jgi:hypothetical protein
MNDDRFLGLFEGMGLAAGALDHAAHVRAAYLCLRRHDFAEALLRFRRSIRAYAASLGKADLYHETITVAHFALIREHMVVRGETTGWEEFSRVNPELLERQLLHRYYEPDELASSLAREVLLLPGPRVSKLSD